ncbi:hypothetical protein Verru16b_02047 [Lacunisphaera limnophila]|uniref:Uncharacterized protein n=1 Tax=Lacunisphaera limnophila TaxID=1838286 RepID=A0A1D8AVP9_9BACT|nr:hypothetical protein [Lacunisphaera limnophila]AOS44978.1 hypothetical protein Verru16b_02047 [Lacunisphaera limnophila]
MSDPVAEPSPSWLQPTWGKLGLAAAVALGGFLLPQEVPLEWYPLNEPGTDINYLEISCSSNVAGDLELRYDVGRLGHRPIDTIRWPVTPTAQTLTYTFPLPDAPLVELRVLPPQDGELTVRQMRIINRRNEEIRRFPPDLFRAERDVTIAPDPGGWKLVAAPGAAAPSARLELFSPIVPVGMDHRNLLRCLLSSGYLAMMLLILLLAVFFATSRPRGWRDFFRHAGFLAAIALCFALVGNRGLIRNSLHYARFVAPVFPSTLSLEFDVTSDAPSVAQVFWDSGQGLREADSARQNHEPHRGLQTLRFTLPEGPLRALRFDPRDNPGGVEIRGIRLVDAGQRTRAVLPLDSLRTERDIARWETTPDSLRLQTTPTGRDAVTVFTPAAVERINLARLSPPSP